MNAHFPRLDVVLFAFRFKLKRLRALKITLVLCWKEPSQSTSEGPTKLTPGRILKNSLRNLLLGLENCSRCDSLLSLQVGRACGLVLSMGTVNVSVERWSCLQDKPQAVSGFFQGGEPDIQTVSKMVLNDWQRGRIPFFVKPPNAEAGPQVRM